MSPLNVDAKYEHLKFLVKELEELERIDLFDSKRASDLAFYNSLIEWYNSKGFWTPKQEAAVDRFIAKSQHNSESLYASQIEKPSHLSFSAPKIGALFTLAATKIKYPSIHFWRDIGEIQFYLCGNLSKTPGVIRVTNSQKYPNQEVYAEISKDGKGVFRADTSANFKKEILSICQQPVEEAKIRGIRSGYCCFCSTPIQTKESLAAGYGPICAANYGLPWGNEPKEEVKLQEI